jgi:glycosyltransferase involved in cell wall biosynthesis
MRVAFLVGSLGAGGLERFVSRISIEAKNKKAFEPVVICLNKKAGVFLERLEKQNITVVETNPFWYRSIAGILALKKVLQSMEIDLVHSQVNYSILQQFIATRLAGKKFTITERSSYKRAGFSLLRRKVQYFFLKSSGVRYSANSKAVASHLASMLNEPVDHFSVIPNGIECKEVAAANIDSRRTALGIDRDDVIIGYVARIDPPKGHHVLIDVINILVHERGCRIKVVLVGDGSIRKQIENRLAALNLKSVVVFVGIVPDVENWMPIFDIVALLSNREGMPNVVIEAMAASKPVIGTAVGNIPELLGGGTGVVVYENDLNGMTIAFENLIRDPSLRAQLGKKGFDKVQREYSLQGTLDILVNYYHSILNPTT